MKYSDKHKLLVIIYDAMIVSSGNDNPTPRIVLNILRADPNQNPEPLSFQSLGEGAKQHNMGKVYSGLGLYETNGHVVPYATVCPLPQLDPFLQNGFCPSRIPQKGTLFLCNMRMLYLLTIVD